MKKTAYLACGFLIALTAATASAQSGAYVTGASDQPSPRDTLMIQLSGRNKMFILGPSLLAISKYERGDSVKTWFISDHHRFMQTHPAGSRVFHYFVHESGRRRIKAESAGYNEPAIDVAQEIVKLDNDLPPYSYIIHDLVAGIEMQVYLEQPDSLTPLLGSMSVNEALAGASASRKTLRRNYRIDLDNEAGRYKIGRSLRNNVGSIEMTPIFGVGIVGNQITPIIGAELSLNLPNKYGVPGVKLGLELTGYAFTEMKKADILGMNRVDGYAARFGVNVNGKKNDKIHWLGLDAGILIDKDNSDLNNALRFGMFSDGAGPFNYGFQVIRTRSGHSLFGFTVKVPF